MLRTKHSELVDTCYLEFQPHKYQNKCWLKTSLFYDEDIFNKLFNKPFEKAIKEYDYYSFIDISKFEFEKIEQELNSFIESNSLSNEEISEIQFFISWAHKAFENSTHIAYLGM